jgi:hypothetical protein
MIRLCAIFSLPGFVGLCRFSTAVMLLYTYVRGVHFVPNLTVLTAVTFPLLMAGNCEGQISLVECSSNSNFVKICQLIQELLG